MTKCPNFKVLWLSSKFVGWSSGSRLVGWNSCWIFFGVIRKCGKKQQGQTVKLRFFWSSSWISGGCLSVLFFFAFGIKKNQVSSNHERHFGRFYKDNSGRSYCVFDFWAKKNCFRPQFFVLSHDPTFKCLYFFLWWEPTGNKKSPTLSSFKGNKKPSTGSAKNWSYFIKLDKAALVLFKEDYCWGSKFPGLC